MSDSLTKEQDAIDARRYRRLRSWIFRRNVDVGEAYLRLKVVGNCPTYGEFDAGIDALQKLPHEDCHE